MDNDISSEGLIQSSGKVKRLSIISSKRNSFKLSLKYIKMKHTNRGNKMGSLGKCATIGLSQQRCKEKFVNTNY